MSDFVYIFLGFLFSASVCICVACFCEYREKALRVRSEENKNVQSAVSVKHDYAELYDKLKNVDWSTISETDRVAMVVLGIGALFCFAVLEKSDRT